MRPPRLLPVEDRLDDPAAGSQVLVARQPIVDTGLRTTGYELLFRGSRGARPDADNWTASLLVNAFADLGLDNLVGDKLAYVNVSRTFLLDVDPLPFGPEGVVLELTEDSHHTDDVLLQRLRKLVANGYRLALDDFSFEPSLAPLVALASIVKLDVLADGLRRTAEQVEVLRPFDVDLLAEKVETRHEFDRCRELGCSSFQGYFFAQPHLVAGAGLAAESLTGLQTIAQLTAPDVSFEDLEQIVACDVSLSYKLLGYVNSGFFNLVRRVESIREAMVFLGERTVRQWAIVMALAGSSHQAPALVSLALLRARLCQEVAVARTMPASESYFMAGLFSVLDALLGVSMEQALERLPLSEGLNDALLTRSGPIGEVLHDVIAVEQGSLHALQDVGAGAYVAATAWADSAASAIV